MPVCNNPSEVYGLIQWKHYIFRLVFEPSLYHSQFPISLIRRLATLLVHLKITLYHHSQILFTFVHLKNSASQCQIRANIVEFIMYHWTPFDINPQTVLGCNCTPERILFNYLPMKGSWWDTQISWLFLICEDVFIPQASSPSCTLENFRRFSKCIHYWYRGCKCTPCNQVKPYWINY